MTSAEAAVGLQSPPTANTEHTQPENRLYFPALDGLRALAVTLVFLQHYMGLPWGYTGVDLFFVLSGFLITGILYDTRNRPDRIRSFYIRRTLRIFPLYYGVLFLLLCLTPLFAFHWNLYWLVWPAYLGNIIRFVHPYSTNPAFFSAANGQLELWNHPDRRLYIGHFWSLCLEEQFYLAWPWVVFWIKDRTRLTRLCAAVVLLMPLVRVVVMAVLPIRYTVLELPYSFTPLRIDALLLGGLLALLIRSAHRVRTLQIARWLVAGSTPLVLLYLFHTVHRHHAYLYHPWRLTWGQSLIDLLYAALIACALIPGTLIFRLGSLRPLRWIGRISYGIYVFHDIPHFFYARLAVHLGAHLALVGHHLNTATAAIAATATVCLAALSFRYFESPFLDVKERLAPSHTAPAATARAFQPRRLRRLFPHRAGSTTSAPRTLPLAWDCVAYAVGFLSITLYCYFVSRHRILWWDEIFGWQLLTDPGWHHMLFAWRLGADGGGLGFYILGRLWLHLFGYSCLSYRAFSAAGCFLGFAAMWRILQRLYPPWLALLAPLFVWFGSQTILSQMMQTRFYGLLLGAAGLALLAAVLSAVQTSPAPAHRAPTLLLVAAANTLLIEAHPFGIVYSALILVGSLISDLRTGRRRLGFYLAAVLPWPLLLFSREAMANSAKVGKPWFWTTTPHRIELRLAYTPDALPFIPYLAFGLLLVALLLRPSRERLLQALRVRGHVLWPAIALFFAPVLFFLISRGATSYFVDRYMIPFTLGIATLLAEAVFQLLPLLRRRRFLQILGVCLTLSVAGAIIHNACFTYTTDLHVPPPDFTPPLLAALPAGLPVVFERVDVFTIMVHQHPADARLLFLLDYPNAIAPYTPRGFVSGYNEMTNWRRAGYHAAAIQDASSFLRTHARFVLVHGGHMHWLEARILNNPAWQATLLARTGPGYFAETIWLVQHR